MDFNLLIRKRTPTSQAHVISVALPGGYLELPEEELPFKGIALDHPKEELS